jgi:cytochrome c biogenesis protein
MSTALWLLLALASAAVLAVAIPQEPTGAAQVAAWRSTAEGPGALVVAFFDVLGLFDVFGSWWFLGLTGLLLSSLLACLLPRTRTLLRSWQTPPPAGRNLHRLSHLATFVTSAPVDDVQEQARRILRRQRYRVRAVLADEAPNGRSQLAAEAGRRSRELSSLVFHWSILLMLAAALAGHLHGFTGQVDLVVGERFAETRLAYDRPRAGPLFDIEDHRGFVVILQDFRTSQLPDGTPAEFVATVAVDAAGGGPHPRSQGGAGVADSVEVSVNHPLVHDGVRLHLARYGWAPRVVVREEMTGEPLFDAPVLLGSAGPLAWKGGAVIDAGHTIDVVMLADATVDADGRPVTIRASAPSAPAAASPAPPTVFVVSVRDGEEVTETGMRAPATRAAAGTAIVPDADARPLEGSGWTVELADTQLWAGFQVTRTPGLRALLVAGVLLLLGLTGSLYAYPRRVWVEAQRCADGTRVTIGGVARCRPWTFEQSFPELVSSLRRSLPAR